MHGPDPRTAHARRCTLLAFTRMHMRRSCTANPRRIHLRGGELGKKFNPPPFLVLMVLHHTAAQCMVIPNNLEYRDNVYYHEAIFMLQARSAP